MAYVIVSVLFIVLRITSASTEPFDGGTLSESIKMVMKELYEKPGALLSDHKELREKRSSQEQNHVPLKPLTPPKVAILDELKGILESIATAENTLYKDQLETVLDKVLKFVLSRDTSEPDETLERIYNVLVELRKRIGVTNSSPLTPDQILQLPVKPTQEDEEEKLNEKEVSAIFTSLKSVIADHYTRQLGQGIGEVEKFPPSPHPLRSKYHNLHKYYNHFGIQHPLPESDVTSNDRTLERIAAVRDRISPLLPSRVVDGKTKSVFFHPKVTSNPSTTPKTFLHTSLQPSVITNEDNSYLNYRLGMEDLQDDSPNKNSIEKLAQSIVQILYPLQSDNADVDGSYYPSAPAFIFPANHKFDPVSTRKPLDSSLHESSTTSKALPNVFLPVQLVSQGDPTTTRPWETSLNNDFQNYNDFMTETSFLKPEYADQEIKDVYLPNWIRPNQMQSNNVVSQSVLKQEIIRNDNRSSTSSSSNPVLLDSELESTSLAASTSTQPLQIQVVQDNSLLRVPTIVYTGTQTGLTVFLGKLSALPFVTKVIMVMGLIITVVSLAIGANGAGSAVLAVGIIGFMIPVSILIFSRQSATKKKKRRSWKKQRRDRVKAKDVNIVELLHKVAEKYNLEL